LTILDPKEPDFGHFEIGNTKIPCSRIQNTSAAENGLNLRYSLASLTSIPFLFSSAIMISLIQIPCRKDIIRMPLLLVKLR
jgi:hypothetical protein